MTYSEVVKAGLILAKKDKYTMHDVYKVQTESLFSGKTLSLQEAVFIVKCSAMFYDTDYSASVKNATVKLNHYPIG